MLFLEKEKKYLLACSFGPDSMALFGMLYQEGYSFSVAHVNYHKRDLSNYEEESLRQYCKDRQIPFYCLDTSDLIVSGNFQAWARDVRYRFFKKIVKENNLDAVLIAHQEDDLLETFCMQKKKESYVKYYGIQKNCQIKGVEVIRPLLSYSKKSLINYCKNYQIPYSIDISNLSDAYERNRIRHHVVELLSDEERDLLKQEIDNRNEKLIELKKLLEGQRLFEKISLEWFNCLEKWAKIVCLTEFCNRNFSYFLLTKRRLEEWIKALESDKPNIILYQNEEKSLVRKYDWLEVQKNSYNMDEYKITAEDYAVLDTQLFYADVHKMVLEGKIKKEDFPIVIRNVSFGDRIYVGKIEKKVSRLFVEWKLPTLYRKIWPIIVSCKGTPIYIPRYKDKNPNICQTGFYMKIK